MTVRLQLPSADGLTYRQHQGWACVWCGASLWTDRGGVSAGRAQGAHGFSIEVYACPDGCTHRTSLAAAARRRPPQTPAPGPSTGGVGPRGGSQVQKQLHTHKESEA